MAITTDNEKYSVIDMHMPWCSLPITAIAFTQGDKQQLLNEYPGILWSAPVVSFLPENIIGNSYQVDSVNGNSNQDANISSNSKQTVSISGSSKL